MSTATLARPAVRERVAYCRISSDRAGAGLGVAAQEAAIRGRFPHVDRVLTDNDVSAYSGRTRPGYDELLALVDEGRVSEILVWHTDRLHRSNAELEGFISLVHARGVAVQSVTAGPLDLATPAGQLNARIAGAIAQHESAHKSERLKLMHARKAEAGQFHGGRRRFGYTATMDAENTAEADAIRDAVSRVLAGESLLSITRDWAARGITTATGKAWRSPNLGKMLRSPHLAGVRIHHAHGPKDECGPGCSRVAADWPAILDAATHEAVVRFLTNPVRKQTGFTGTRRHALSGLLECGVCGAAMYGRPTPLKSGAAYVCRGNHVQAPVAEVETTVRSDVAERLSRVDASGAFVDPTDAARVQARSDERLALEGRRAELAPVFAAGGLSAEDYAGALAAIDARLLALEAEAVAADDAARLPVRVLDGLTGHPADVTAQLVAALPGGRFRAVVAVLGTPALARASRKGARYVFEPERVTWRWANLPA
jgi:site-specific DNA recombinase